MLTIHFGQFICLFYPCGYFLSFLWPVKGAWSRYYELFWPWTWFWYLALINRAGGLYQRILTKVISTDWTQWGLHTQLRSRFSHTDRLSWVNKMFIIWQKQEQFNSFNVTGLYQLTFCFRMTMSRISFFQILLGLFTFFSLQLFCHLQK